MFNLGYTEEALIKGTIKLNKKLTGLGKVTDVNDMDWHINGIIGNYVQAVPYNELHPYYTDTSSFNSYGFVQQTWHPYLIEYVND